MWIVAGYDNSQSRGDHQVQARAFARNLDASRQPLWKTAIAPLLLAAAATSSVTTSAPYANFNARKNVMAISHNAFKSS